MNILIRTDSSSLIGTGHVMRDLVLAKQYVESNVIFATQNLEGNLNSKIVESGYEVQNLKSNNIDELIEIIQTSSIDMVIIDHYGIDYNFEKNLKEICSSVVLFVFDDTYEKHHCDILLNHNISANEQRYEGLLPSFCELRCGARYTLIREEFLEEKKTRTIFIAMGGADHNNTNIGILKVLSVFSDIQVNLVTTAANRHIEQLKEYTQDKTWVELHINSNKIAKLMSISDLAIITPSVTLNEIFFMEIPFIAIQTADNQQDMAQYLSEHNYTILEKFDAQKLKNSVDNFFKPRLINFIELSLDEKRMVLEWRNHSSVRKWMITKDEISLNEHLSYIDSLDEKKDRNYFLVKEQNKTIGVIDYTEIDYEKGQSCFGLYAKPNSRGSGTVLMQLIIEYAFMNLQLKSLIAEVFEDNHLAIGLYKKFNFKELKRTNNIIVMELSK